jgi:hypothetical protein
MMQLQFCFWQLKAWSPVSWMDLALSIPGGFRTNSGPKSNLSCLCTRTRIALAVAGRALPTVFAWTPFSSSCGRAANGRHWMPLNSALGPLLMIASKCGWAPVSSWSSGRQACWNTTV